MIAVRRPGNGLAVFANAGQVNRPNERRSKMFMSDYVLPSSKNEDGEGESGQGNGEDEAKLKREFRRNRALSGNDDDDDNGPVHLR